MSRLSARSVAAACIFHSSILAGFRYNAVVVAVVVEIVAVRVVVAVAQVGVIVVVVVVVVVVVAAGGGRGAAATAAVVVTGAGAMAVARGRLDIVVVDVLVIVLAVTFPQERITTRIAGGTLFRMQGGLLSQRQGGGFHLITSRTSFGDRVKKIERFLAEGKIRRASTKQQVLASPIFTYFYRQPYSYCHTYCSYVFPLLLPQGRFFRGYSPYRTDKIAIVEQQSLSCYHAALVAATGMDLDALGNANMLWLASPYPCLCSPVVPPSCVRQGSNGRTRIRWLDAPSWSSTQCSNARQVFLTSHALNLFASLTLALGVHAFASGAGRFFRLEKPLDKDLACASPSSRVLEVY